MKAIKLGPTLPYNCKRTELIFTIRKSYPTKQQAHNEKLCLKEYCKENGIKKDEYFSTVLVHNKEV